MESDRVARRSENKRRKKCKAQDSLSNVNNVHASMITFKACVLAA
jgi:hypothetical protein